MPKWAFAEGDFVRKELVKEADQHLAGGAILRLFSSGSPRVWSCAERPRAVRKPAQPNGFAAF
jgi:hypothetical protein